MQILQEEVDQTVVIQPPGHPQLRPGQPDHDSGPIGARVSTFAADRQHYVADSLQYLFPIGSLALLRPVGRRWNVKDPRQQDDKNDFQKQNLKEFTLAGIEIARGFAAIGEEWIGSFLSVSYVPLPGSPLLGGDAIYRGDSVRMFVKVGDNAIDVPIVVPYDEEAQRFHVEFWSLDRPELAEKLGRWGANPGASTFSRDPTLFAGRWTN